MTHTAQAILRSHKSVIRLSQLAMITSWFHSYVHSSHNIDIGLNFVEKLWASCTLQYCNTVQVMWPGDTDGSGFAKPILRGSPSFRWKPCPVTLHFLEMTENSIFLGQAIHNCHGPRSLRQWCGHLTMTTIHWLILVKVSSHLSKMSSAQYTDASKTVNVHVTDGARRRWGRSGQKLKNKNKKKS